MKKFCTIKLALKILSPKTEKVGIGEKILIGKLCGKVLAGKLATLWNTISQVSIIPINEIINSEH